jgi:hypothetical protein
MVLIKDQNAWGEVDPQQGNIDEETETCVGVRGVSGTFAIERVL